MVDMGTYECIDLESGKIIPKYFLMNAYVEEVY